MAFKSACVFLFLFSFSICSVLCVTNRSFAGSNPDSENLNSDLFVLAADTDSNPQADNTLGTVTIKADSSIINLEKGKRGFKDVKGYRIQIFVGTAEQMKAERNKFLSLGLNYSVYPKQIVPEYAIQVGDFPTRMEMEKHLEIIKKHYPKAFPVVEVIETPKFGK